ncbi:hypothetical protein IFM61606_06428 [Aspergillus udagawae]|uniref:Uncharacterized protein n=1 Tax=Aspergillus udagawae TaxID=91492 RepID=A0ABQ1AW23_9EURO|nr:hypothetical protein IFM51744_07851 [Aspergillus udagawae]GFF87569.1 hypothetical protein IFM53868_05191 [Aspergillus udagawae]GFG12491.1 hypothetical protein IFM5058_05974 [Aspergillus udagawae]GFG26446.1 hypothetical protein IFM61606_06428 [Aspergillus udagawae]
MGQTATKESPDEFLPPVQTREELYERFEWCLWKDCLGDAKHEWFQTIFQIFCTESESENFWTVSDLQEFMVSTFPPELAACVREAAPILHRCLLRLGSFPYHNDPRRIMSRNVLRTGIIILLRLNGGKLLEQDDGKVSLIYPDRLNAAQRVLLFQSMADMQATTSDIPRNVGDDFHLQKALDLITYGNFRRNPWFPTAVTKGPEYPPPEHFPSSKSTLTNGSIPLKDFRSLLRLMLLTQLHVAGIEPDEFTSCLAQVETVTDCLLAAFQERNATDPTGVSFATFDQVLGRSLQNLFLGLPRVFGPLHSVKPLPSEKLPSSVGDAQMLLRELFAPSAKTQPPPEGLISNLPLLSQLSMALPQDFPIEAQKRLYSSRDIDIQQVDTCVSLISTANIMLVSGKSASESVIFGAYFPKGSSLSGVAKSNLIFQLAPVPRVFYNSEEMSQIKQDFSTTDNRLEFSVKDDVLGVITLALQSDSTGLFTAHEKGDISLTFDVDAVEVFSYEGEFVRVDTFA